MTEDRSRRAEGRDLAAGFSPRWHQRAHVTGAAFTVSTCGDFARGFAYGISFGPRPDPESHIFSKRLLGLSLIPCRGWVRTGPPEPGCWARTSPCCFLPCDHPALADVSLRVGQASEKGGHVCTGARIPTARSRMEPRAPPESLLCHPLARLGAHGLQHIRSAKPRPILRFLPSPICVFSSFP